MKTYEESKHGASPWNSRMRIAILFWEFVWFWSCQWTPKPLNVWRLAVLRFFGAKIHGRPFVHQRARIQIPWNLGLHDRACIGDRANLYCLDRIVVGARSIVGQEAYLCTGTHGPAADGFPLLTSPIEIGDDVFVGARAFVMPGRKIGDRAIIGACSVVTKDVASGAVVAGQPARVVARTVKAES
jgi:putative colanic acid biosynthesis acetyltransferase WcaF